MRKTLKGTSFRLAGDGNVNGNVNGKGRNR